MKPQKSRSRSRSKSKTKNKKQSTDKKSGKVMDSNRLKKKMNRRLENELAHEFKKASTLTNFRTKRAANAEIHADAKKVQNLNDSIISEMFV